MKGVRYDGTHTAATVTAVGDVLWFVAVQRWRTVWQRRFSVVLLKGIVLWVPCSRRLANGMRPLSARIYMFVLKRHVPLYSAGCHVCAPHKTIRLKDSQHQIKMQKNKNKTIFIHFDLTYDFLIVLFLYFVLFCSITLYVIARSTGGASEKPAA